MKQQHKYSSKEISFLRKNIAGTPLKKLTILFNKRFSLQVNEIQIKGTCTRYGLTNDRCFRFSQPQKKFIKNNVLGKSYKELTELFNTQFLTNLQVKQIHKFCKDNGFLNGFNGQFKKGCQCAGKHPIGFRYLTKSKGYCKIKVAEPDVWKYEHHLVWEAAHGAIPQKHNVAFADGNKRNVSVDNLILISQVEHCVMNRKQMFFPDTELTKVSALLVKLNLKRMESNRILSKR